GLEYFHLRAPPPRKNHRATSNDRPSPSHTSSSGSTEKQPNALRTSRRHCKSFPGPQNDRLSRRSSGDKTESQPYNALMRSLRSLASRTTLQTALLDERCRIGVPARPLRDTRKVRSTLSRAIS